MTNYPSTIKSELIKLAVEKLLTKEELKQSDEYIAVGENTIHIQKDRLTKYILDALSKEDFYQETKEIVDFCATDYGDFFSECNDPGSKKQGCLVERKIHNQQQYDLVGFHDASWWFGYYCDSQQHVNRFYTRDELENKIKIERALNALFYYFKNDIVLKGIEQYNQEAEIDVNLHHLVRRSMLAKSDLLTQTEEGKIGMVYVKDFHTPFHNDAIGAESKQKKIEESKRKLFKDTINQEEYKNKITSNSEKLLKLACENLGIDQDFCTLKNILPKASQLCTDEKELYGLTGTNAYKLICSDVNLDDLSYKTFAEQKLFDSSDINLENI